MPLRGGRPSFSHPLMDRNPLYYFRQLPFWVQTQILTVATAAVVGFGLKYDWTVALVVAAWIVGIVVVLGGFYAALRYFNARRATAFGGEINQQNTLTPRAISDPAKQARLDDLRRNFNGGLARFQAVGKDLYKLPWYVIVGEPGAGKTEAIRHSGVGFPPGMQDELQGVGGTINMNWWFTNQAVILDTAGRLLFEEVEPGSTNEWREFLDLLKKYRPNCPVNGLFLALPADSLIREGTADLERKAGRIARQLEVIQRQFDLRFPVFVVITKCDLLNGFREFFENLDDPSAKNQMIGWSNPDPLDTPFRTELIDAHIETSLARLRRRRLALLADPVALAGAQARRLDEVDRLYALPQSLALLAPRLRRYLEIIFTANEWSAKPLFLRGIYFTSSLREGSALDQELAEAIGVGVDQLPEGRAWDREETYFLRDVFLEKGFREKGLVTRASNTRQLLRKRQALVFGAGFAAVALLALVSIFAQGALQRSIARQGGYWLRAADGWQEGNRWQPALSPGTVPEAKAAYAADAPVGPGERANTHLLFNSGDETLTQFQADLRELAATPLEVSWIFRPLASFGVGIDDDRRRAQRVVFEDSVEKPLLDAARARMVAGPPGPPAEEDGALLALVRFEAAVARKAPVDGDGGEHWNERFLAPLLPYASGKTPGDDTRPLASIASWTYSRDGSREAWAPEWLSGGANLGANKPIAAGLDRLAARVRRTIQDQATRVAQLGELADLAKAFRDKETELHAAVTSREALEKIDVRVFTISGFRDELAPASGTLKDAKGALDRKVAEMEGNPNLYEKAFLLRASYERGVRELGACEEQVRALLAECEPFAPHATGDRVNGVIDQMYGNQATAARAAVDAFNKTPRNALFTGAAEKLRPLLPEIETARTQNAPDAPTLKTWQEFDTNFLEPYTDGRRLYAVRWDEYLAADSVGPAGNGYASSLPLIGAGWKPLQEIFARTAAMRADVNAYQRGLKERYGVIVGYILNRVERFHGLQFPQAYLAQVRGQGEVAGQVPDDLHDRAGPQRAHARATRRGRAGVAPDRGRPAIARARAAAVAQRGDGGAQRLRAQARALAGGGAIAHARRRHARGGGRHAALGRDAAAAFERVLQRAGNLALHRTARRHVPPRPTGDRRRARTHPQRRARRRAVGPVRNAGPLPLPFLQDGGRSHRRGPQLRGQLHGGAHDPGAVRHGAAGGRVVGRAGVTGRATHALGAAPIPDAAAIAQRMAHARQPGDRRLTLKRANDDERVFRTVPARRRARQRLAAAAGRGRGQGAAASGVRGGVRQASRLGRPPRRHQPANRNAGAGAAGPIRRGDRRPAQRRGLGQSARRGAPARVRARLPVAARGRGGDAGGAGCGVRPTARAGGATRWCCARR